jgi:hypothetical protein
MKKLINKYELTPLVTPHLPFARLYRAVISRAVEDLAHKHHGEEARKWLLSPDADSAFATAGISPHRIRLQIM